MQNRLTLRVCLVLFVVTSVVYSSVVKHGFVIYDDASYVTGNPVVRRGLSVEGWHWAWTAVHAANWHPLTWLSHMLDCQLFGLQAWGHHLTNLAFHDANTLLLFLVLRRLTGAMWQSALVAALFGWHPLHVESVAWIAERKDVLSTCFGLLGLGAYVSYTERPGVWRYVAVLTAFTLSLLAKPMLVTLPCVFLLLDYWPLRRFGVTRLVLEKVPLFLLSAVSCAVTFRAQVEIAVVGLDNIPWSARVENAMIAYVVYLRKTVWPVDLAVLYPHPGRSLAAWQVIGAGLILGGVTVLALARRRRRPALLVGWLWYLGTLVPVIGLVQVGLQGMADRYTYFPLIGIFFALSWSLPVDLAARPWGWRWSLVTGIGAALAACLVITAAQLRHWQNEATLWRHAVEVTQNNSVAHLNLGGEFLEHGRIEEADEHFTRAVALAPRYFKALYNLGHSRLLLGQLDDAEEMFRRTLELYPENALGYNRLGLTLAFKSKQIEAADAFRQAIRLYSEVPEFHFNLAQVLDDLGDHAGARAACAEGLQRDETWPHKAQATAQALLESDNPKIRITPFALFRALQACQAANDVQPEMLETLAAAYAARRDASQAAATAQRALDAAITAGRPDLAQQIRVRLHRYQKEITTPTSSFASQHGPALEP